MPIRVNHWSIYFYEANDNYSGQFPVSTEVCIIDFNKKSEPQKAKESYLPTYFRLRGRSQITLTRFWLFYHLPPCVDIFYGINVDKKWTFLDHLPTLSCKRSLWTTPLGSLPFLKLASKLAFSLLMINRNGKTCSNWSKQLWKFGFS